MLALAVTGAAEFMCEHSVKVDTYKHFVLNVSGGIPDLLCEQGGYVSDIRRDVVRHYKTPDPG